MYKKCSFLSLFILSSFFYQSVLADVVILKNGDRLSGTITSKAGGNLLMETKYAGTVNLPWSEIQSLSSDKPVRMQLSNDRVVTGKIMKSDDGALKLVADELFESKPIPLAEVQAINPPVHDGKVKVSGIANLGGGVYSGNTDKKHLHVDAEVIARSENNRVTIGGAYDWSQDQDVESTNKGIAYGKYDHFINDKWYAYGGTSFEMDKLQDLDLRTTLSGGVGYQIIETDLTQFSIEGGPSYVNENYGSAADQDFAAGRWAVRLDHWLRNKFVQFFHYHEGLISFDNTEDVYIRSRTGLRIPIYKGLAITTEVDVDYDAVPAPGKKKTDTAYLINLGYGF